MSNKKKQSLSPGAQDAIISATPGDCTIPARVLKNETAGIVWGDHARDKNGKLYPLQPEKLAAIKASYEQNGVLPFTLTAILTPEGITKLTEGRHRVAMLSDDAPVSVRLIDGSNLDAVTIAARSNGEGMGFTLTAAIEQTYAGVMELCNVLAKTGTIRTGRLAALPLPKPKAARAYTADKDGNPFASHTQRGGSWSPLDFTGEGLASMLGLSPATVQRVLEILSGLWNAEEDPSAVAGMTTDNAKTYAKTAAAISRKLGDTKEKNEQTTARRAVRDALRKGKQIKNRDGVIVTEPAKLADAVIDGNVTAEKPTPKDATPRPKRTTHERIVALLKDATEMAEKMAEEESETVQNFAPVRNFYDRIRRAYEEIEKKIAAKDAAAAAAATEEDVLPKQSAG